MAENIVRVVDSLPTGGITVGALRALDFVAPGEWQNTVGWQNTIQVVTGETDPGIVAQVSQRAQELFNDPSQGYQRALWIYQTVDSTDKALGAAAMAHMAGERFAILGFLSKITPKEDTAQTIDLVLKIAAELVAFTQVNGLPGDSIGDFVAALGAYQRESLIRMAGVIAFDGVLPLGPNFLDMALNKIQTLSAGQLEGNGTFQRIREMIPGGSTGEKQGFLGQTFGSVSGWMGNLAASRGITPQNVIANLHKFVDVSEQKADVVAAYLDVATNYFEHTGTQSLARSLVERAVSEI